MNDREEALKSFATALAAQITYIEAARLSVASDSSAGIVQSLHFHYTNQLALLMDRLNVSVKDLEEL